MAKSVSFDNRDKFIQLGITISALRKFNGLSQRELAEKVGVSRNTISAIESTNSPRSFSVETFLKIAYALNVNPADMISASVLPDKLLGIK